MLKSFVFTHCAVESRRNNLYFKRWLILCRLVMWQIENAVRTSLHLTSIQDFSVTDVLALAQ